MVYRIYLRSELNTTKYLSLSYDVFLSSQNKSLLLSNSENCELLKIFRNVDCVVTNHNEVQDHGFHKASEIGEFSVYYAYMPKRGELTEC